MTEDFWANVDAHGAGCWLWKGRVTKKGGYGCLSYRGRTKLAHRVAWEQVNGALLPLECIGWTCENKLCCNPHHMFKYARKSHEGETKARVGEKYPHAHLKLWQVAEIRQHYATGKFTYKQLSAMHGVKEKQIGRIVRRDQWKEESGV